MVDTKVNISESSVLADEAFCFTLPSPSADATVYHQHKEMSSETKTALAVYNGKMAIMSGQRATADSILALIKARGEFLNVLLKPYGHKILTVAIKKK